jgi:hypothetical protein
MPWTPVREVVSFFEHGEEIVDSKWEESFVSLKKEVMLKGEINFS